MPLCSLLLGISALAAIPGDAYAQTALTWARIEFLRNRVQLVPQGRSSRAARLADIMGVGDALRTAASSRAELRFNDGSLARIGERAVFRFTPNTRNFQLSNGTMLLLIPPGQGRTTIQTPHAVTGIQGSALFVRTIPETNTTIVGALTNNIQGPMVVYCEDGSVPMPLYAGQMAVIENCQTNIYDFDLRTFYETSGLVEGLQLDNPEARLDSDELNGVRQEILDALEEQGTFEEEGTLNNPGFLIPPEVSSSATTDESATVAFPNFENSPAQRFHNPSLTTANTQNVRRSTVAGAESTVSHYPHLEELNPVRGVNQPSGNQASHHTDTQPIATPSSPTRVSPSSLSSPSTVATGGPTTSGGVIPSGNQTSGTGPTTSIGSTNPSNSTGNDNGVTNPSIPQPLPSTGNDTGVTNPSVSQPSPAVQTPSPTPTTPSTPVVMSPPVETPTGTNTPGTTPGANPDSGASGGRPDLTVPNQPDWTGTGTDNGLPAATPESVTILSPAS